MYLYRVLFVVPHTQGAQAWITQFYLQITPISLYVSLYVSFFSDSREFVFGVYITMLCHIRNLPVCLILSLIS